MTPRPIMHLRVRLGRAKRRVLHHVDETESLLLQGRLIEISLEIQPLQRVLHLGLDDLELRRPDHRSDLDRAFAGRGTLPERPDIVAHPLHELVVGGRLDVHALDRDADLPGIDLGIDAQLKLLRDIYPDIDAHPFHERDGARPRFDFDNTWFTSYDALVYSALLRAFKPKRIVEVGSGWSTAIILDTYEGAQPPDITLIEPHPDRLFTLLRDSDHARLTILEQRLQDCPLTLFEELGDGDVLFVDSTHVAKLDSDVNQLFFEILPRLNVGVLVHLHDVAYPFDYEPDMIDQGFGWNEAYLLRAFLQFNDRFEIVLWNDLLRTRFRSLLEEECPVLIEHECPGTEGSIWIRRVR